MTVKIGTIWNYSNSTVYLKNFYDHGDDKEVGVSDSVQSGAWIPGAKNFANWIGNIGNGSNQQFIGIYNENNAIVLADTGDWGLFIVYGSDATLLMTKAGTPSDVGHHVKANSGYCLNIPRDKDWESFDITFTDTSWFIDPWDLLSFPTTVLAPPDAPSPTTPTGETISLSPANIAKLGPETAWAVAKLAWNFLFRPDIIANTLKDTAKDYEDRITHFAKAWKEMAEAGSEAYQAYQDTQTALNITKGGEVNFVELQDHVQKMVAYLKDALKDLKASFVQSIGIEGSLEGDLGVGVSVSLGLAIDWDNPKNWAVYLGAGVSGGIEEGVDASLSFCLNGSPASGSAGTSVGLGFELEAGVGGSFNISLGLDTLEFGGVSVGAGAGEEFKLAGISAGATTIIAQGSDATIENVPSLALGRAGYWVLYSDGTIDSYGNAVLNGDGIDSDSTAVDLVVSSNGGGYWILCQDGGIHTFGNASYHGNGIDGDTKATALAVSSSGGGYWILCENGGIHTYGNVTYCGHGVGMNTTAADIAITPNSGGYWILAANGDIHNYGNAQDYGHGIGSDSKAVALAATPDGDGYWILCENGGIHNYGSATYYGHGIGKNERAVDIGITLDGRGYWIVADSGNVYTYGYAKFHPTNKESGKTIVAIGISPLWEPPQEVLSSVDAKDILIGPKYMSRYYAPGYSWVTASQYRFTFQEDGNLVLYSPSDEALWFSGTDNQGAKLFSIQLDGDLVIYKDDGTKLWSSSTSGNRGAYLDIQNDGNVVLRDGSDDGDIWSTATYVQDSQGYYYQDIVLKAGDSDLDIKPGQFWVTNSDYMFAFQKDGNFVIYDPSRKVVWASNTFNQQADKLSIQTDGNVVIYKGTNPLWKTDTQNYPGAFLVLENSGNLSVREKINSDPLWQSNTGSDMIKLQPQNDCTLFFPKGQLWEMNSQYCLCFTRYGNLELTNEYDFTLVWQSETGGKGADKLAIQTDGNVVIYDGDKALWSTGTDNHQGAYLGLSEDGTLAVYDSNNTRLWTTS